MNKLFWVVALGALLSLSACNSVGPEWPTGVGGGANEYKPSPCACEPFYRDGQWLG